MELKVQTDTDVLNTNTDPEQNWRLCCSVLHKAEVVFFVQIIFLFTIMIFSMIQIINKADSSEIYFLPLHKLLLGRYSRPISGRVERFRDGF